MAAGFDYYGEKLISPRAKGFALGDWFRARSEVKAHNCELYVCPGREQLLIVDTPYIRSIKAQFDKSMRDNYLVTFTVAKEQGTKNIVQLEEQEKRCLMFFERNLDIAEDKHPLQASFNTLNGYRDQIIKQASDLRHRAATLEDFFITCFKDYEKRSGMYVRVLSKRIKRSLMQGYTQSDFAMIAQTKADADEYRAVCDRYESLKQTDQTRLLKRIAEIQKNQKEERE
ncbi:MAG: hypothetical protein LBG97_08320 [Coriobacteriales bacterium]|jgi:hypothetical protein|nr:hypothetical protein [Coriobacteriales bacterium]